MLYGNMQRFILGCKRRLQHAAEVDHKTRSRDAKSNRYQAGPHGDLWIENRSHPRPAASAHGRTKHRFALAGLA
jgi:hypothetical protein